MKLGIETYSETDWGSRYVILWVDHNFWCSFIIRNDNSIKAFEYPDSVK